MVPVDTALGEGAAQVSGGERARIGLAHAALAEPAVLVLDEPTAHLDVGTAREVARDLLDSGDRRTRHHRLSTVRGPAGSRNRDSGATPRSSPGE